MKFVLEVNVPDTEPASTAVRELSRVLRYWGGNLHHYALAPGTGETVYDSGYREVGRWTITESTGSTDS
ncbi:MULTISPECIES: hypothetical protein [unclassified Streptomyces]|uniref:hypothetical protein n=1 Tax=Streptomyces sp. NPDC005955 TaxID=3364738 RepID=UPI0036C63C41